MTICFPLQMHKLDFYAICKWISSVSLVQVIPITPSVITPTVHHCIQDICDAIWQRLVDEEMPVPTKANWIRIEHDFNQC